MRIRTVKHGMKLTAKIGDEIVTGTVTGFGTHKGKPVIDLGERFVYLSQVISVN